MFQRRVDLQTILRAIPVLAWLLIAFSALLQVAIFPMAGPVPAWRVSIGWLALVPFLLAILRPAKNGSALSPGQAGLLGYGCGILWYLGNCYWIYQTMYLYGGLPKPVSFGILILFACYLGLYHALFAALVGVVRRSRMGVAGGLLVSPFVWVAVELARGRITSFPWDLLGNSQVDNLWLTRIAPVAGVMAMSFVLAAVNAGFAAWLLLQGKRSRISVVCAALASVALQAGMPTHALFYEPTDQTAVMMQENLEVGELARYQLPIAPVDELRLFSDMSVDPKWYGSPVKPTVVVWPEAPSELLSFDPWFRQQIGSLAKREQAPAIIGSVGIDRTDHNARGYFKYDSASLFDADGVYRGRYDKVHLVPWGEYVPFSRLFFFAHKLTKNAGDMDAGTFRSVFTTGGHTYGVFICYESIFGDEVRQFVNNGAEVLVNISDDGWYGDSGAPWQHLNITRMRAIESHRWLLLDTNTGVTTAIDPEGRATVQAPRHVRDAYAMGFAFTNGTTFYTRQGDWFAWICVIVSVGAVGLSLGAKSSGSNSLPEP
jgi:apolipoprotein N-acyltransferase